MGLQGFGRQAPGRLSDGITLRAWPGVIGPPIGFTTLGRDYLPPGLMMACGGKKKKRKGAWSRWRRDGAGPGRARKASIVDDLSGQGSLVSGREETVLGEVCEDGACRRSRAGLGPIEA